MALSTAPKTTNFLSPLGAKFTIKKLPTVNFFVQRVAIPSLTVGEFPIGTPFSAKLQMPGDLVTFGDLVITFRVDENMDNYTLSIARFGTKMISLTYFIFKIVYINEQCGGYLS